MPTETPYYHLSDEDVTASVASTSGGLTAEEAERRLAEGGKNKLDEGKKTPIWKRFLQQLADPMIIILLIAAGISLLISLIGPAEEREFADVIIILAVVLINATLGVIQESKAEAAIEALKQMTAATTKVLRDGKQISVKSEELVVGDVILLEAGDAVPADARLLECASLKCEEAAMTGESVPVEKTVSAIAPREDGREIPLGDRKNMVYMGGTAVYGRAKAVVTATGMDTEMGKIAGALVDAEEEKTPLQMKLSQLSKILTYVVLGICGFIFLFQLIANGLFENGFAWDIVLDTFIIAVSLAVAAIPEGLAAVVTIELSIGVTRMSKQGAVIRKMSAVETLGCTEIICSDKTGTLTQNKMTVVETACTNNDALLARAMALCSDAKPGDNGEAVGEPTECALVNFAGKVGPDKNALDAEFPRIGEIPFDSERKMMSTVCRTAEGLIQYTKGAPDEILARSTMIDEGDGARPMTAEDRTAILAANKGMADRALRVLAAAYKKLDGEPTEYTSDAMEKELVFCGLTGMIDPVRPEVKAAIDECRTAGIRPIMITGDHKDTAVAIATELGIITSPEEAITGAELNDITDEDFAEDVTKYSVYARVQPEHKLRIVRAWRAKDKVTAMTGDGVNDAPSIKGADIGVGMGITGTDVTKNVADMILADDNFATIVGAAEEGRRIYDNIRRAIRFLLSSNLAEVVGIFFFTILALLFPTELAALELLAPTHILFVNLITDSLPALALGMEAAEKNIMNRPPRKKNEGIFAGGMAFDIAYEGILIGLLTLGAFLIGHYLHPDGADGTTMAFLTLSMAEIFHSYNMRSERGSIFSVKTHNVFLFGAMALAFVLTLGVIYIPFFANAFDFTPVSLGEYAIALGLAFSVLPIVELVKLIRRRINK